MDLIPHLFCSYSLYIHLCLFYLFDFICIVFKAENVLGVSESDMINYHSVFADSGNSGAQVCYNYSAIFIVSINLVVVVARNVLYVWNGWSREGLPGKLSV